MPLLLFHFLTTAATAAHLPSGAGCEIAAGAIANDLAHDQTAALNAALLACEGGTVSVPRGTYRIDGTVTIGAAASDPMWNRTLSRPPTNLHLAMGVTLRRFKNCSSSTQPVVRIAGYASRLTGEGGEVVSENAAPLGIVHLGPDDREVRASIQFTHISGVHISGRYYAEPGPRTHARTTARLRVQLTCNCTDATREGPLSRRHPRRAPTPQLPIRAAHSGVVGFISVDGGWSFDFSGVVVDASDLPESEEGACEPSCTLLRDGTLMCVIRIDGGDGNAGHSASDPATFKDYVQVFSKDGRAWTAPTSMHGMGCVRPQLLMMGGGDLGGHGGPLLLAGGRMRNHNTSDILLWVNHDGLGRRWEEVSISSVHNDLAANASWRYDEHVNSTDDHWARDHPQTTSYTSLLRTAPTEGVLVYDRLGYDWQRASEQLGFSMRFRVGG